LSTFPVFGRVRIELATMFLLEQRAGARTKGPPVLIVGPYAVHDASIADFAEGHSLAQILGEAGLGLIALTFWKSATHEMRDYGIDVYLSDLNVAIDDLGGRASLVGLCQGGWLAATYAARFPQKVAKLVLAGAPIDLSAAESGITRALAAVSPATVERVMALAGGRVSGPLSLALWSDELSREFNAEAALQCTSDAPLAARFDEWNVRTVDLPGAYFLQTTEWVFRENRLARGCLPALGRQVLLSKIGAPNSSSLPPTTRSSLSRRPWRSRCYATQLASSFASSRGGTCRYSWGAEHWRVPGATSRAGLTATPPLFRPARPRPNVEAATLKRPIFIARQFARPSGLIGRVIADIMGRETAELNNEAIRVLEPSPTDWVLEVGFGDGRTIERLASIVANGRDAVR
jgi:alpha/beta hydrolase family protein